MLNFCVFTFIVYAVCVIVKMLLKRDSSIGKE